MPTLTIDWERSPRIIVVDQPDTEISVQQIVDLLRDAEDDWDNSGYPRLIDAAGKEALGGGTLVGITAELQNAVLAFDDRTNKLESGTVTTPDASGKTLTDSAATFQTNNVEIGDLIVNTTDGSHATIVDVTSETSVLTTGLQGGTDNQFASADAYEVWEIFQCQITGGNLVAVDDVGADLSPILNSFGTYTIVSRSSSATLQEQSDIQHASFDGGVHVDVNSSTSGTAYPSGNAQNPVNNWADAVVIASQEGFTQFFVEKSTTLDNIQNYTDATFVGKSIIDTVVTVPSGTTLDKAEFFNISLEGTLGDTTIMQQCFLGETNTLNDVRGVIEECSIGPAKLTLGGTSSNIVRFVNCRGAGSQFAPPTINCGGNGPEVDIQDYVGRLNIENKTGTAVLEVSIVGELILDSTVTNGTIIVNGTGNLTDNSGAGATVINNMIQGIHLSELWKLQGLERGNPMTVTPTFRSVQDASINLSLTGDGVTSTIVTRTSDQTLNLDVPLVSDLSDLSDTGAAATFTRASSAWYKDPSTGNFVSAAANEARFELEGLLLEESRTNLFTGSNEIDSTATNWPGNGGWTVASATSIFNGETAYKHTNDGLGSSRNRRQDAGTFTNGQTDTFSVIIENDTATISDFAIYDLTAPGFLHRVRFTWATKSLSTTSGSGSFYYEDMGTGPNGGDLVRISITGTGTGSGIGANGNSRQCLIYATGTPINSDAVYLHHAQLEENGEFSTSPIVTTATSVTRNADSLTFNNDSVVENTAGSIICDITPLYDSTISNDAAIVNITNAQVGPLYVVDDTTQKIAIGDGTSVSSYDPTLQAHSTITIASRWSVADNEMQAIANGAAGSIVSFDNSFTRTPGTLYIGSAGNSINGNVRNLKIYNVDRGEAQLLVDTA